MLLISSRKAPQCPHIYTDGKRGTKDKHDGEPLQAAPSTFAPPYPKLAIQAIQATWCVTANLAGHASRNGATLTPVTILAIVTALSHISWPNIEVWIAIPARFFWLFCSVR